MEQPLTRPAAQGAQAAARDYALSWQRMMVRIWTDRIALMGAVGTGRLMRSVDRSGFAAQGADMRLAFRFVQYGLYVDRGTGKGCRPGNGGRPESPAAANARHPTRRRERRPWLSVSWAISREVIKNEMARLWGDAFRGAFDRIAGG